MSIANQKACSEYLDAVEATEEIESPALGFVRPSDYKSAVTLQNSAIIKQNNILVYLLIKQAQRFGDFEEKLEKIKRDLEAIGKRESESSNLEDSIESLSKRLDGISINGQRTLKTKQGPIYVFKDPNQIFKEEYEKETKKKK